VITPARSYRDSIDDPMRRLLADVFIAAVTAAVVAVAILLGRRAVFDMTTAAIAAGSFVCLVYVRRIPPAVVILSAVAIGLSLTP
jgi:chromate transport protein ChrA